MRETAETIEETALRWVARLDREGQTVSERPDLQVWLAEDTRHRGAFMRAMAVWQHLQRANALSATELASSPPVHHPNLEHKSLHRRLLLAGAASAASIAGLFAIHDYRNKTVPFSTMRGEIRRVPLNDGSLLAINTDTELKLNLAQDLRALQIIKGETWVQVAPDADRPFIVSAGDIRVRAIGTAFSVRKMDTGAEVLVTEGVVEAWSVRNPADVVRLPAGQSTTLHTSSGKASPVVANQDEVQRRLAWREGDIVLSGESLSTAVTEFNRYNLVQIKVLDPALADTEWIGRFRTNEPQAFARAVAVTTGAPVQIGPDTIAIGQASE
ncbi:FecR family protein [Brevundimonas sp.]|uniref:FecR family protein n=1 Tax=Brevundimonas sp. TaxID=1871086 RepID=UPI002FC8ED49